MDKEPKPSYPNHAAYPIVPDGQNPKAWQWMINFFPELAAEQFLVEIDRNPQRAIAFRLDLPNALPALRKTIERQIYADQSSVDEFIAAIERLCNGEPRYPDGYDR